MTPTTIARDYDRDHGDRNAIDGLEPQTLFRRFYQLTKLYRNSCEEGEVRDWLKSIVKEHEAEGWECYEDNAGNIAIRIPATPGAEGAPVVILQAHMDMVYEPATDKRNYRTNPVMLKRAGENNELLMAEDSSLGIDNGFGLATAVTAAEDENIERPETWILGTSDEEEHFTGAENIDRDQLHLPTGDNVYLIRLMST